MRTILVTFGLLLVFISSYGQTSSVEKSIYGIQTGYLGIYIHNELKVSKPIALRIELGLDNMIWWGTLYPKTTFLLAPVLTIEPRWYFNLLKRLNKSKRIDGNSGSFLSIKCNYHPNLFVISNYDGEIILPDISIIPTWGIKRNLGKHFQYETGIGIGYRYSFDKSQNYYENNGEVALNLHLRIGYRF